MSRILLSVIILSGLVFLVCLVQNSGSSTYVHMIPFPNGQTQMPSKTQLILMSIHDNPWIGVSIASAAILAMSIFAAAVLFVCQKLLAPPRCDAP